MKQGTTEMIHKTCGGNFFSFWNAKTTSQKNGRGWNLPKGPKVK